MVGAGIFVALGPAAAAAGPGLLVGMVLAAVFAFANAASSAQLAAIHPVSGGTYVYGTRQLGRGWGLAAGWSFVVGKVASCAAIAVAFGNYVAPGAVRPAAFGAVVVLSVVNYRGVRKTAGLTWFLVVAVVAILLTFVGAVLGSGSADATHLQPLWPDAGALGVLRAGGLLFFAFAGYARVATLGEEVAHPARTIPRAITVAVVLALLLYAAVAVAALAAVGAPLLATSPAPLEAAARASGLDAVASLVRVGAALATLGVLLSLLAGVGRTVFAMAADGHLPRSLGVVHPAHRVPHRAEMLVGGVVATLAAFVPLAGTIGVSAFTVLLYYAITNASALTLRAEQRRFPRWLAWLGLAGCLTLAFTLPPASIAVGAAALAGGLAFFVVRSRARRPSGGAA
jgi:APA family basic amino acid/polyamine antiporter